MSIRTTAVLAAMLTLTIATRATAQQQRIAGRVEDAESHDPIPAAQVQVTGTTFGALTGADGRFTVPLPSGQNTLTVRRIGYKQTVVPLTAGQTDFTIALKRDVLQLDQQVITGVATTSSSKTAATYDPVVSGAQLNAVPSPTVENALQGKAPGAEIEQNSGAPGGGLQVNIRGVTTINATSGPLYVVDGIIVTNTTFQSGLNAITSAGGPAGAPTTQDQGTNRIADLNPSDIESIQILSGAAAASIYGSRAAGGVILITTKKGVAGKPQLDFSQKVGTFNLEHELDMRHYSLAEAYANGGAVGMDSGTVLQNYNACKGFCDFQKSLYGGGELSYETDLSLRGGGTTTNYFLSALTKYDNGAEINTGYNKQAVRANVNEVLWGRVTISATAGLTSSLTRRGIDGNDNLGISGYDVLSYTPSWFNMAGHTPNGVYVQNPFGFGANAYQDANAGRTPEEVERAIVGANIDWKVFNTEHQSLDVAAVAGADFTNQHDQFYLPPTVWVEQLSVPQSLRGVSTLGNSFARLSNYSLSLIHKLTFSSFNATTSIGVTRDKAATYQTNNTGEGLLAGYQNWTSGSTQVQYYNQTEANNQGYYGQEQLLLFDEHLNITGGANAVRSSSDGGVNRYYIYPKVAAAYRFTNVAPEIDEVKLRAAYGQTGNLPNYGAKFNQVGTVTYDGVASYTFEGANTAQIAGDPDIKPETNTDYEAGLDLTLFKSRAQLSGTVYQKRVTDLLLLENVAPSSGFTSAWTNGGQITNQGLELALSATPIQAGKFSWISTEAFARNYSRVDNLPPQLRGGFTTGSGFGCQFGCNEIELGASASALYGVRNGAVVPFGNAMPAFTFSFTQDLSYGPLHGHVMFDWREGQSAVDLTGNYFDASGFDGHGNLADTALADKRTAITNTGGTAYLEHASFLKLRELGLKYDLPQRPIDRLTHGFIRYASLSLTGRNLLTWTRYLGADPEVSNFSSQALSRGQDVTPYPPTRSYFLSLDLGL